MTTQKSSSGSVSALDFSYENQGIRSTTRTEALPARVARSRPEYVFKV